MKKIYTLSVLMLLGSVSWAQNAFYDARQLEAMAKDTAQISRVINIFKHREETANVEALKNVKAFLVNPFDPNVKPIASDILKKFIEELEILKRAGGDSPLLITLSDARPAGGFASGANTFGNQLVGALTSILVDRAKTELTILYFESLRDRLDSAFIKVGTDKVYLKKIFPRTFELLNTLDADNLTELPNNFQIAIAVDFQGFPARIDELILKKKFGDTPYYAVFSIGVTIADLQRQQYSTPEIFHELVKKYSNAQQGIVRYLKLADILSQNLRAVTPNQDRYWITRQEFQSLGTSGRLFFAGLLYQNNRQVFSELLPAGVTPATLGTRFEQLTNIVSAISLIDDQLHAIREQVLTTKEDRLELTGLVLDQLPRVIVASAKFIAPHNQDAEMLFERELYLLSMVSESVTSLRKKEYGSFIMQQWAIADTLGLNLSTGALKTMVRYSTFFAALLDAKTEADKRAVLESAVLPPTSYRLKRSADRSCFINAYVGASGGAERLDKSNDWGGHVSFFAPIGIEFAKSGKNHNMSYSLLCSIIDLGSVVSYRLSGNEEGVPEDFKLANIVSPGVFLVAGLGKTPLSIGIGGQFTGNLRTVDNERVSSFRIGAFIAVDLPLFRISAKGKSL